MSRIRGRDEHTLAGAYAMDAISAADRDRFERHLAGLPGVHRGDCQPA